MNDNLKYQPHQSKQKYSTNHTISGKMELKCTKNQFLPPDYAFIMYYFLQIVYEVNTKLQKLLIISKFTISMMKSIPKFIKI